MVRLIILIASFFVFLFTVYAYFFLPLDELKHPWIPNFRVVKEDRWLAVLGDSSVTGAAAHPALQANFWSLFGDAVGLITQDRESQTLPPHISHYIAPEHYRITQPDPPTRLFYTQRDLGWLWPVGRNLEAKAAMKLDTEEYTFGYLLGRRWGVPPNKIVIAGRDGAMINSLGSQVQRLLDVAPVLPPVMLISFVANELCDPLAFNMAPAEFSAAYGKMLRVQLQYLAKLPPHPEGTRIVFLAPLDLANILTNPSLMSQPVSLQGDSTTCGQLREDKGVSSRLTRLMQKILINECPAVFSSAQNVQERLARIKDLQAGQIQKLTEEIALFNQTAPPNLRMMLGNSVRSINFQTGDLAGDCFHPSLAGHTRIANALLANELRLDVNLAPDPVQ